MSLRQLQTAAVLLLVVVAMAGCGDMSCSLLPGSADRTSSTFEAPVTSLATTTTEPPTTSTTSSTTTTTIPRTTTTVDPLETYRDRMWTWKTRHAGDLSASYAVISKMGLPVSATEEEIQAAKDLDRAMAVMVDDLALIKPTPELAAAHDQYLASLKDMAAGVHDLATALEGQKAMRATAAIVAIATAWEEGAPARTTLEQALGFSLSSAS